MALFILEISSLKTDQKQKLFENKSKGLILNIFSSLFIYLRAKKSLKPLICFVRVFLFPDFNLEILNKNEHSLEFFASFGVKPKRRDSNGNTTENHSLYKSIDSCN